MSYKYNFYQKAILGFIFAVLLLIFAGAIVRVTGSGMGCPDWPKCWGKYIPPLSVKDIDVEKLPLEKYRRKARQQGRDPKTITRATILSEFNPSHTWIEYLNRLTSLPVGVFSLCVLIGGFYYVKRSKILPLAGTIAIVLVLSNAWLGKKIVDTGLQPGVITLHMILTMLLLCILIWLWHTSYHIFQKPISTSNYAPPSYFFCWQKVLTITLFICCITEALLGSQIRELTDELQKKYGVESRENWLDTVEKSAFYLWHRSLTWLLLIISILLFIIGLKKTQFGGNGKLEVAIFTLVICQGIFGIILANVGIIAWIQVLHVAISAWLITLSWWLVLKLKKTTS